MKLTFLGTGSGMPSKQRNVSSVALHLPQEAGSHIWLFDCGEATQHQILKTTLKPRRINKIFITHLHGDHIFGLPGFLSSRSFLGGDSPLTVYGPKGIKKFIETSLFVSDTHLSYPLSIVEINEGELIDNQFLSVQCKKLSHGVTSYGFKIEEKDRPGELLVSKLRAEGIEPGPIYREIKENEVTITESGQKLKRAEFVGPDKPGRTVCILGDTKNPEKQQAFVKNADLLVHEATFSAEHADLAKQYNHSTTKQAAQLAKDANVKSLILTHISSRYQYEQLEKLTKEARSIFPETSIAKDFNEYTV